MSGGSYNYLCYKDASDINNGREDLENMRDRLIELGYKDAAQETESVILMLDSFEVRLNARLERLNQVWHSVEWCDSGDSGEEGVRLAVEKYRNN